MDWEKKTMAEGFGFSIDPQELTGIVSQALDEPVLGLGEWQMKTLSGGLEEFNRVYQLAGQAQTASGPQTWVLVLKTMLEDPSNDANPHGTHYWKREAAFYQSGLIDYQSGSLAMPRCYQVTQQRDKVFIWMESVQNPLPRPWPEEKYVQAAQKLGHFNGEYLAGKSLPDEPWLARYWMRGYSQQAESILRDLPELHKLAFFDGIFAEFSDDFLLGIWARRDEFLDAVNRLPQTFCHQDTIDANLIWRRDAAGQEQLLALDWAYTGLAAAGIDVTPLVYWKLFWSVPAFEEKMRLYELCLQAYQVGLTQAGCVFDARQVRFAAHVSIIYRYFFGSTLGEGCKGASNEAAHPFMAAALGLSSIDAFFDCVKEDGPFIKVLYKEICDLLPLMP